MRDTHSITCTTTLHEGAPSLGSFCPTSTPAWEVHSPATPDLPRAESAESLAEEGFTTNVVEQCLLRTTVVTVPSSRVHSHTRLHTPQSTAATMVHVQGMHSLRSVVFVKSDIQPCPRAGFHVEFSGHSGSSPVTRVVLRPTSEIDVWAWSAPEGMCVQLARKHGDVSLVTVCTMGVLGTVFLDGSRVPSSSVDDMDECTSPGSASDGSEEVVSTVEGKHDVPVTPGTRSAGPHLRYHIQRFPLRAPCCVFGDTRSVGSLLDGFMWRGQARFIVTQGTRDVLRVDEVLCKAIRSGFVGSFHAGSDRYAVALDLPPGAVFHAARVAHIRVEHPTLGPSPTARTRM